jgi:hypothetical protein
VTGVQKGQLTIRTALGTFTVQTTTRLPLDSQVTLEVRSTGDRPRVLLLLPTPSAGQQASAGQAHPTGAETAPGRPATPVLTQGSLVTGTVTGSRPAATPQQGDARAASAPAASQAGGADALRSGTNLILRVIGVSLPSEAQAPRVHAAATPGARVVAGTVGVNGPAGFPLIHTQIGDITLSTSAAQNLAPGSRLLLEIVRLAAPAPLESAGAPRDGLTEALRAVMDRLFLADPGLHRHLARTLPNPGPRLAPAMLFLLSAVLSGDMRRVLGGDGLQLLSRLQRPLIERLGEELGQAQRSATPATPHDLRAFTIPVAIGETFEPIYFLFQREPEDAGSAQAPGTRFVIEVELSRLGPFRFDGLARANQVDLAIETRAALPEDMQRDIRAIFVDTLSALGFAGTLAYHTTPDIRISGDTVARGPRDLTV